MQFPTTHRRERSRLRCPSHRRKALLTPRLHELLSAGPWDTLWLPSSGEHGAHRSPGKMSDIRNVTLGAEAMGMASLTSRLALALMTSQEPGHSQG